MMVLAFLSRSPKTMKVKFLTFSLLTLFLSTTYIYAQVTYDIHGPEGSSKFGSNVTLLPNGHFIVTDPEYGIPNGPQRIGAVFHYDDNGNLLSTMTGSDARDKVGVDGITVLANGNYVIASKVALVDGARLSSAVTFCEAKSGCKGRVSSENSLYADYDVTFVTPLPNGNYVVRNPFWNNGPIQQAGAVTLCNGGTGCAGSVAATNSLVGSNRFNHIGYESGNSNGSKTLKILRNGNFLVLSPNWSNGSIEALGAVTFCREDGPCLGVVSHENSLVGSSFFDLVGRTDHPVELLPSGGYVIVSPFWGSGLSPSLATGAVTFGNGETGVAGEISASNSLIGSPGSRVGPWVHVLQNGNYVVSSPAWGGYGRKPNLGAVTLGNGTKGIVGVVGPTNSLIGSSEGDQIGGLVTEIDSGDFVVNSTWWDKGSVTDAGIVAVIDGKEGRVGELDPKLSLTGSRPGDRIGLQIEKLSNGKIIVYSPYWDNGEIADAGAVTMINEPSDMRGSISTDNSFTGTRRNEQTGMVAGVRIVGNDNYLIPNPYWSDGRHNNVGAVTFLSSQNGFRGNVTPDNSLIGSSEGDSVGRIIVLPNGNYLVASSSWNNGSIQKAGAVSFCRGDRGCKGAVTPSNSLVGTSANDRVGASVTILANSSYLVASPQWSRNGSASAGAVTYGSRRGIVGFITPENSLVGSSANDRVGTTVLKLGENAILFGSNWNNGQNAAAGAVTFYDGSDPITGTVSDANSLVGSSSNDRVGEWLVKLSDERYAILSPRWNNEQMLRVGAVTIVDNKNPLTGYLSGSNSLIGSVQDANLGGSVVHDKVRNRLFLLRFKENMVTIIQD
jgi:hypothetical protein